MNTIQKISKLFAKTNSILRNKWPEYNPTASGQWIRESSGLPWLKLDIEIPRDIIHKEISSIKNYFVEHRADYSKHMGWKSFCIHGKAYDATREETHYTDQRPYIWTPEAVQLLPETVKFFQSTWPNNNNYRRIRIMELAPGGIIPVHRDSDLPGQLNEINIAITQPNGCNFYMENYGVVPYTAGDAYMLNISNRHTIINDSPEFRYHIIVHHGDIPGELDSVVVTSYNKTYAS
jgi:hypothetical protein